VKTITLASKHKSQIIDISSEVKEVVITSGIKEGICVVFTPHTTASVVLFENADPKLQRDFLGALSMIAPHENQFSHAGGNATAHIKSSRAGMSITVPVANGQPLLGEWQGIFFAEFDGPRDAREVIIKVIAG